MPILAKRRDADEEDSDSPTVPDGGWGWAVVFGSFMIHIITDGVTYTFGVFYDEFLRYFGEGKAATAWIASILVGVTFCSGPISSIFVNRWGCRAVTIAGAILGSASMAVSVFAQNVTTLYFTIGIGTGLGFGLIYLPAIVSVTTYFEKKRSLATGIAVCGSGLGTFIFSPIITRLLARFGWRISMLIIAGTVLKCVIYGVLFRPLQHEETHKVEVLESHTLNLVEEKTDIGSTDFDFEKDHSHRPHSLSQFSKPLQNGNNEHSRLTLSQPMLTQADRSYQHYASQSLRKHQGLLNRPDVFYQRSLINIPPISHRSRLSLQHKYDSIYMRRPLSYANPTDDLITKSPICGCIPRSEEVKHTFNKMLDFALFKDWVFVLFAASNFLTSIGLNIPYLYIVSKSKALKLSADEASMLLSFIGIANTLGRIVLGYISDKAWVNRLMVYNWCLAICGVATVLSAFCYTFMTLAIYTTVFGFTMGAYVGLTSVILVDLLGIDKLTNAFGLLLLFQGVASLIGPPIAGALYDSTQSSDPAFYLAGVTIALSGIILFILPPCLRYMNRKETENHI